MAYVIVTINTFSDKFAWDAAGVPEALTEEMEKLQRYFNIINVMFLSIKFVYREKGKEK